MKWRLLRMDPKKDKREEATGLRRIEARHREIRKTEGEVPEGVNNQTEEGGGKEVGDEDDDHANTVPEGEAPKRTTKNKETKKKQVGGIGVMGSQEDKKGENPVVLQADRDGGVVGKKAGVGEMKKAVVRSGNPGKTGPRIRAPEGEGEGEGAPLRGGGARTKTSVPNATGRTERGESFKRRWTKKVDSFFLIRS